MPIYAVGGPSDQRAPCLRILQAAAADQIKAFASTEMIQEFVFHRLRRTGDRQRSVEDGREIIALTTVLDFGSTVLTNALDLIEHVPTIRRRDAVHAATALVHEIPAIVSPDRVFDGIPGIRRLEPAELAAALA